MTVLMVGVGAADLSAAGTAEQGRVRLAVRVKGGLKALRHPDGPLSGPVQAVRRAVQGIQAGQCLVTGAGAQGCQ